MKANCSLGYSLSQLYLHHQHGILFWANISIWAAFTEKVCDPLLLMCRVQKFIQDVSIVKWTRNTSAPTPAFLFVPNLYVARLSHLYTHTHTFTQTHIFILDVTAPSHFHKFAFRALAPIPLLLLLLFFSFFPTSCFMPPSSPGPSITLQRSHSCHLHV